MLRRILFVASALSVAAAFACSDSNNLQPPPAEAGAVCPTSPKDAVGKACGPEGYSCAVGYLCPVEVWQQAQCTCKNGKYACVDSTGTDVAPGVEPSCTPVPAPTETCGNAASGIAGKACSTAGYACYFAGVTCPGQNNDKPYTDDCVCSPKPPGPDGGTAGLQWRCVVHTC